MPLSNDIISEFAKLVNKKSNDKPKTTQTLVGTVVESDGMKWVKLDGSDNLTPIESIDEDGKVRTQTVTEIAENDRVTVEISNHTATVTGNLSTPSASTKTTEKMGTKISEFEIIVAYRITTDDINATNGYFEKLQSTVGSFGNLTTEELNAINASINSLKAKYADLENITADDVKALNVEIENLKATFASIENLSTEDLDAANADIDQLTAYNANFTYVHSEVLSALKANINQLDVDKLDVKFANIDQAWFDEFYSKSGIIEELTTEETTATKRLIGVYISGDMIEGNTIKADKLLLKGEGGLYYQMNINAEGVAEGEEVSTEGIDGRAIVAESITADKMKVTDLHAFGATIGGTQIEDGSIHSYGKDSINSTVRGLYLDKDGQFSVGNNDNHLKFYISVTNYRVDYDSTMNIYTATEEIIEDVDGSVVEDAYVSITDGENSETYPVYFSEEKSVYFYKYEKYKLDIIADRILFGANSSDKLKSITEHIKIGKYVDPETGEENPCVELSEDDSVLSQIQTNKRTVFKDGDIEKMSIGQDGITTTGEIRHTVNTAEHKGQYIWATRANGNFGLMWKDVIE